MIKKLHFKSNLTEGNFKKPTLSKVLSTLVITTLIVTNSHGLIYALPNQNSEAIPNPTMEQMLNYEEVPHDNCLDNIKRVKDESSILSNSSSDIPGEISGQAIEKSNIRAFGAEKSSTKKYSMSDLNRMNYTGLINLLVTIEWSDITDLFQYNTDAQEFYSNTNRMQALLDAIEERGSQFTSSDTKGLPTLIEVFRAGNYLGFYNKELESLNTKANRDKCIPAILAIEKNPNFKLGTKEQDDIIASTGLLINATTSDLEVVNYAVPILKQYNENFDNYTQQYSKGSALFNMLKGISYTMDKYIWDGTPIEKTPYYKNIDSYISELNKIAIKGNVNSDNEWVIDSGIYYIGELSKYASNPNDCNKMLTDALKIYPYLSSSYFKAADQIYRNFNGKDYYGNIIDINKLNEEGKQHYLPKTYVFDDGKFVFKVGDKISDDKIQRLYWATKEVNSQFYRIFGDDTPIDKGPSADDVLTVVVYNTPDEYKMNSTLYGFSTDNGGIYIEGDGTFFTYERTPEQSIYSLEELFRHEFTHYLQGRYLVPGMWGQTELYKNDRLCWYEEGSAEFFAGSTRTQDILPRYSIVGSISNNPSERYTIDQLVHSGYSSGWSFYHYGFAFNNYLYNNNLDLYNKLADSIKSDNVNQYDNYIKTMSNDKALNTEYQKHMQDLVDNRDTLTVPLVSDDYLVRHADKSESEIFSDITSVAKLKNVSTEKQKSPFFNTFTLRGTYTLGTSKGKLNDWELMNSTANNFLNTLNSYPWSGYKTLSCYFVNYKVDSSNNAEFEVVFQGILSNTADFNNPPVAKINGPYTGTINNPISFSSEGSTDSDGKIVSYLWDFGDGTTSNDPNPDHLYTRDGNYNVKLTVTDDKGAYNSESTSVNVIDDSPKDILISHEPNDTFETANGPILSNTIAKGTLDESNGKDIFYFDVTSAGEIDIAVTNEDAIGINWVLYSESDHDNYIAYATNRDNGKLTGLYNAPSAGRYYLVVYKHSGTSGSYTIDVKGPLSSKDNSSTDDLISHEPNDTFETANGPILSNTIAKGTLDESNDKDIFYFDVTSAGEIDITVNNENAIGMNWLLYSESDHNNYVAYATNRDNGKLTGSYDAPSAGRYYLVVYKYSEESGSYTIDVKGALSSEENSPTDTDDTFEAVNGLILSNTITKGTLDESNEKDIFYFDVTSPREIDIAVNNEDAIGMNWMLYSESDNDNCIAYATNSDNGKLTGSYDAPSAGRYYLLVYKFSGTSGSYTIDVKGALSSKDK